MFKTYQEKRHFSISRYSNMIISQAMSLKIVSIDTSHNIFSINRYIIKLLCIFKLVRAYLREQRQLCLILWCLSLKFGKSMHTPGAHVSKSMHPAAKMCTQGAACTLNFAHWEQYVSQRPP